LGYRVVVYSPDYDTPAGQVADTELRGAYDNLDLVAEFAKQVAVVTFEFENVPSATTAAAERFAPVRPGGHVLHTTQNRLREKSFIRNAGLPVTPFLPIRSLEELHSGLAEFGCPAIERAADAAEIWQQFASSEAVLEKFIDFQCEVSVIGARGLNGDFVAYGPVRNSHSHHILDVTVSPAGVSPAVEKATVEITRTIFEKLDVVGVLCVEFFVDHNDQVMVNELAPRPHNSGHFTIDSCVTCQFEQQVRAICGLPLGSPRQHRPAAMANLLGDVWNQGEPNWSAALQTGDVKLHLYGKTEPRVGRKMGHLTALADSAAAAEESVRQARAALECGISRT
jgi:5-(carboxyamino)imidazole ribonucleotide synthase